MCIGRLIIPSRAKLEAVANQRRPKANSETQLEVDASRTASVARVGQHRGDSAEDRDDPERRHDQDSPGWCSSVINSLSAEA